MSRFHFWLLSLALVLAGCAGPNDGEATADASLAAPPAVIVPADATPQTPLDRHVPGVANFGFVSADLWRGSRATHLGNCALLAVGVSELFDLVLRVSFEQI